MHSLIHGLVRLLVHPFIYSLAYLLNQALVRSSPALAVTIDKCLRMPRSSPKVLREAEALNLGSRQTQSMWNTNESDLCLHLIDPQVANHSNPHCLPLPLSFCLIAFVVPSEASLSTR